MTLMKEWMVEYFEPLNDYDQNFLRILWTSDFN
jgi:hypothetical protein